MERKPAATAKSADVPPSHGYRRQENEPNEPTRSKKNGGERVTRAMSAPIISANCTLTATQNPRVLPRRSTRVESQRLVVEDTRWKKPLVKEKCIKAEINSRKLRQTLEIETEIEDNQSKTE
ncbi:hypothetical protein C1H46_033958 [Malus baccata]|uniref:Uncharacterized protein n=1 Tax=Malus baccata TaxID=106549 RepID=A0A540L222_MALBA|nr:hypothetical protein C1H46_033958 [Malus baccata]